MVNLVKCVVGGGGETTHIIYQIIKHGGWICSVSAQNLYTCTSMFMKPVSSGDPNLFSLDLVDTLIHANWSCSRYMVDLH